MEITTYTLITYILTFKLCRTLERREKKKDYYSSDNYSSDSFLGLTVGMSIVASVIATIGCLITFIRYVI